MDHMQNISVIDLGTGSIRNTIYGKGGEILSVIKKDNPILHPKPGWVEQDPVQWWETVKETFSELDPAIRASVSALSVTSQREGIVPVDARFNPLDNIIIWLDGRTYSQGLAIEKKIGKQKLYEITGLVPNPAWSLAKILWIKENHPELYNRTSKFLQAGDYLLSRMSGRAVTEFSIASRTCLLDVANRKWSDEILDAFEIERNKLPELLEPGTKIGAVLPGVAREFGLNQETELYMGAGDQQAAAIGVGATEEGMVSIGIGTSSALSMTLNRPVKDKQARIILNCAALPGKWEYEPPIWNTGGLIKWFTEQVHVSDESFEVVYERIEKIPPGSDGLWAIPYFSGAGSPRWNPVLKGGFYGLNLNHNHDHMLRAIMESIAYEIRYNIDTIRDSGISLKKIVLSGGASQNGPLCQIIADVLQTGVYVFTETEASSRGIYYLLSEIRQKGDGKLENTFQNRRDTYLVNPDPVNKKVYDQAYKNYLLIGDKLSEINILNE
jgi:xylulokinase